jgi:preprotein translocase subunit SecA
VFSKILKNLRGSNQSLIIRLIKAILPDYNQQKLQKFYPIVEKINQLAGPFEKLTDEELKQKTVYFKQRLSLGASLDDLLVEAFATVREASRRTIGLYHYDVQLLGGIALHKGMMTEMKTGEGKTLVATLAAYLNALGSGKVHIATVNDYLAKRDADEMGRIYRFLGLTCNAILENMTNHQRQIVYASDIVYSTGSQLGFDYLRDNMVYEPDRLAMQGMDFIIIDEADTVIDDGRTPMILSSPSDKNLEYYGWISDIVTTLTPDHYTIDAKNRGVIFTEAGVHAVEDALRREGVLKEGETLYNFDLLEIVAGFNEALKAHLIYKKDIDYIVRDGQVMLIDEMTGRILEGRRLSEGLHQALEAKEKVEIHNESLTSATISYQKFFSLYTKISGMSGTCLSEAEEFKFLFGVDTIAIPTHMPVIRVDLDDEIYITFEEKLEAVVREVEAAHKKGQPVLVITGSVSASDIFSAKFSKVGLRHRILNARYHKEEAEIIAQAGMPGAITIATNMAGRGTDIQLGGNHDMKVRQLREQGVSESEIAARKPLIKKEIEANKQKVIEAGGLYVIGTERNESRRVDDQARGRAGRQGDPGKSKFLISLDDVLMQNFAGAKAMQRWAPALGVAYGEELKHPRVTRKVQNAQRSVEADRFDSRKHMVKYDEVLSSQLDLIYHFRRKFLFNEDVQGQIKAFVYEELLKLNEMPEADYIAEMKEIFSIDVSGKTPENESLIGKRMEDMFVLKTDVRYLLLSNIDMLWEEHLTRLDYLRKVINLRSYAQKDPLVEYKREGFAMFEKLSENLRRNCLRDFFHA